MVSGYFASILEDLNSSIWFDPYIIYHTTDFVLDQTKLSKYLFTFDKDKK